LLPLVLALVSGVLMAVQGSLNSVLSKVVGLWEATFIVHITGTVILFFVLFFFKIGRGSLAVWSHAPWYAYLGGVVSVFIIYLVAASIPEVGVSNATTAIIVGQVLTAVIIDHFGGFGLERIPCGWNQLAGLVLLAIGAKLLLK
jgi:transporter family-2 protein